MKKTREPSKDANDVSLNLQLKKTHKPLKDANDINLTKLTNEKDT